MKYLFLFILIFLIICQDKNCCDFLIELLNYSINFIMLYTFCFLQIESGHFDPTIPRFFSHKIPRTRDGSLDFGRSKPVDYSFLDYSNPNFQAREAALHNPLKRPGSAHIPPSETMTKLQRRSPPHEFLPGKHRLPDAIPVPKPPGAPDINHYEEKWRALSSSSDSTEKRFCSICNKDAQYLCSGCRKVWYCSQECQVNSNFL